MSIYSFKTDVKFDKKIDDILVEIPKGSRSAFIKDALMFYIEQAQMGVVSSRYIQKGNMQNITPISHPVNYNVGYYTSNEATTQNVRHQETATLDKDINYNNNIVEDEVVEDLENSNYETVEIEGNDENLDIFG